MDITVKNSALCGTVTAPPSKSMAHRALLAAALAKGQSVIKNVEFSEDIRATAGAARELSAYVSLEKDTLTVQGPRRFSAMPRMDCGESGTTLRLLVPVIAALGGGTVTGRGRLPSRPLGEYIKIFERQGIPYTRDASGLPLKIQGTLKSGVFPLSGAVSSQYVSGLLFALPLLEGDSEIVIEDTLESSGYVDMTLKILSLYGVDIEEKEKHRRYCVRGGQSYKPCDYTVEGDWSNAAFFLLAGAVGGDVTVKGLKPDSMQKDKAYINLLKEMGADIRTDGDAVRVVKSGLHAIQADVSQTPDIAPALAGAMAIAEGTGVISGGARLKVKESDRIASVASALNAIGAKVSPTADGMVIEGAGRLKGGAASSHSDHRIAMTLSALAAACEGDVTILDAQAINKSYPSFFEVMKTLGGQVL